MVSGMATVKVTVTLDELQLKRVRSLVASGKAENVSAFVKHAVNVSLQDVVGWGAMLSEALLQTGGPLKARERSWADGVLGARAKKGSSRRAA